MLRHTHTCFGTHRHTIMLVVAVCVRWASPCDVSEHNLHKQMSHKLVCALHSSCDITLKHSASQAHGERESHGYDWHTRASTHTHTHTHAHTHTHTLFVNTCIPRTFLHPGPRQGGSSSVKSDTRTQVVVEDVVDRQVEGVDDRAS